LWSARSGAPWLQLQGAQTGIVDSDEPVAALSVLATAKGMNDTAISGPIVAIVTVSSSMPGQAESVFENASHVLEMQVELSISAEAYLLDSDVEVRTSSADMVTGGGVVIAGDTLKVTVNTFDCERVPISRPGLQIVLSLRGGTTGTRTDLHHQQGHIYEADVPSSWIEDAGSYTLWVNSTAGEPVRLDFKVTKTNSQLYIGIGIVGILVVTGLVTAYLLRKHRNHAREFLVSFLSEEVFLVYQVRPYEPNKSRPAPLQRTHPMSSVLRPARRHTPTHPCACTHNPPGVAPVCAVGVCDRTDGPAHSDMSRDLGHR
jgi:hypothetical protein